MEQGMLPGDVMVMHQYPGSASLTRHSYGHAGQMAAAGQMAGPQMGGYRHSTNQQQMVRGYSTNHMAANGRYQQATGNRNYPPTPSSRGGHVQGRSNPPQQSTPR